MRSDEFQGTARFAVVRRVGAGGAGVVYEAYDRELGARVALKRLRRLSPDAILRFKREFRSIEDVEHPNLAALGELFEEGGDWFYTMEFVDGVDFLAWVRRRPPSDRGDRTDSERTVRQADLGRPVPGGPADVSPRPAEVDERRLRRALEQLVSGLDALHAAGKVHRDVKPSNVLVTPEGRVVLLDFGLAKDATRVRSDSGAVGTPSYMAPEQALGLAVDARADLYSVGVVLYRALTGRLPFLPLPGVGDARPLARPSSLTPGVPEDLDALCMDLLRVSPELRPSAREALRRITGGGAPPSSRAGGGAVAPPAPRRFVGRDLELAVLREAFDRTLHGECVVAALTGDSGLGKSTLVRHFGDLVADDYGALVLASRCYERESVPFKAVDGLFDALARWLGRLPPTDIGSLLPEDAHLLGHAFAALRPLVDRAGPPARGVPLEPREQRARLFGAARALFVRLAAQLPLVLVIDDLQWSDSDGLGLLREVLRQPDAPSLLLLATVRSGRDGDSAVALTRTLRDDAAILHVEPLGAREARELALDVLAPASRGVAGPLPDIAALAEAIAQEGAGHPLFIDALARSTLEARGPTPALRLEDALRARVERLDDSSRRLLEAASVAGAPLRIDLAAQAAGTPPDRLPRLLRRLQIARLAQTRGERRARTVEPYHDRVRQAVLGRLDAEDRRRWHLAVAEAMEASPDADADAIASHLASAGEGARAARFVELAAQRAAASLAWGRAAELYRALLALGAPEPAAEREIRTRLGEALVAAGRGEEAARELLAAARGAAPADAVELQRRAAEQLLTSGHIERGLAALRPVLGSVGERVPRTRAGAALSLAWSRARLGARGLAFRERSEGQVDRHELGRVDALAAAAAALGMTDTIRGADLSTRHLLAALEAGEPRRLARAISLEGAFAATAGTRSRPRTERTLALAWRLSERCGDPLALAQTAASEGVAAFLQGRWREARDACARAEELLRVRCSGLGVAFLRVSVELYRLGALLHTGELRELARRLPPLLEDARERGDVYASTHLRSSIAAFVQLCRGDPAAARREARAAIEAWPHRGTHMPHFFDVLAQAQIDLYEGAPAAAHARVSRAFATLRRAMLLRVQFVRIKMLELRARTALARAIAEPESASDLLRRFEEDVAALARERAPWADALADLLCAARAHAHGELEAARRAFEDVATAFERCGMDLHAAVARRRAELPGAESWFTREAVVDPGRLVAVLSPNQLR